MPPPRDSRIEDRCAASGRNEGVIRSLSCVPEVQVRAFLLGELANDVVSQIIGHLESCPQCVALADRLDTETDPFVQSLRRALRHGGDAGGPSSSGVSPTIDKPRDSADFPQTPSKIESKMPARSS